MLKTFNGGKPTPEFNNAAQVVNHTFFWESMSPNGGGERASRQGGGLAMQPRPLVGGQPPGASAARECRR